MNGRRDKSLDGFRQISWQQVLAALYDRAPFAVLISDANRYIVTCNPAFERLFGYTADEIAGETTSILYSSPNEFDRLRGVYDEIMEADNGDAQTVPAEIRYRKKSGEVFLASVQGSAIYDDDGNLVAMMGLIQNISTQRELELELESLFEYAPVYIMQKNADGRIIRANPHCADLMGRPISEIIGALASDLQPAIAADILFEDQTVLRTGEPILGILHELTTPHRGQVWLHVNKVPFENPITGERSIIVIAMDVTELKDRETELQSKSRDLESFAYMASHDLQEPLRKISMYASIFTDDASDDWERNNAAAVVTENARHARSLISDLLSYSRSANSDLNLTEVDIAKSTEETVKGLSRVIEEAGAEIAMPSGTQTILADRNQFQQLLDNLISNAIKYRKSGRGCRVSIDLDAGPDGAVKLSVSDNGIGFGDEHKDQIFRPFVRLHTRSEIPGTGIGLAICNAVADRHGWTLQARSNPGQGSVFSVLIPKTPKRDAGRKSPS